MWNVILSVRVEYSCKFCEHGNELQSYTIVWGFFCSISDCCLIQKRVTLWDQFPESDIVNSEITGSLSGATHPNNLPATRTCSIIPQHLLRLWYCQLSHRALFAPSDRCLMYTKTEINVFFWSKVSLLTASKQKSLFVNDIMAFNCDPFI